MKRKRIKPRKKPTVRTPKPAPAWEPASPDLPSWEPSGLDLLFGIPDELLLLEDDYFDDDLEYDEDGYVIPRDPNVQMDRDRQRDERDIAWSAAHGFWGEEVYADYGYRGYRQGWHGFGYGEHHDPTVFVRRATEWADRVEPACPSAPFWAAYQGFEGMREEQLRWFFHWRGLVRGGAFPRTPGSYVNLLAYEVLNGIGVDGPEQGLDLLVGLDKAYSKWHKLGYLFDAWIEDYAFIHKLGDRIPAIRRARGLAEKGPAYSYLAIDARADDPVAKLPAAMIEQLGHALVELGAYSRAGNERLLAHVIPRAVGAVDAAMRRDDGRGLIARHAPTRPRLRRRWAFEQALVAGKRRRVEVRLPTDYARAGPLIGATRGLIEHAENRLRTATGFPHLLPTDGVDPAHAALIDEVIAGELPELTRKHKGKPGYAALSNPIVVTIDPQRVGRLRTESDRVRGMLIDAMGGESASIGEAPPVDAAAGGPAAPAVGFTDIQMEALDVLMAGGDVDDELRQIAGEVGVMPAMLLDGINEAAQALLGDAVVDLSGSVPSIYDEYRTEIAEMMGR